uniref:Uncharacterized protein n=1 Tax=Pectinophora gossypiella TaxID=13191 RepID=A0A1E1W652_PECGO
MMWCGIGSIYAVVSEYFGRGLFNKLTVVTDEGHETSDAPTPAPAPAVAPALPPQVYGPGAEAKLRLQEGQSKQVFVPNASKQVAPKGTAVIPVPEGRMRLLEQQRYSSSLEANMNRLEPRIHQPKQSPLASPMPGRKADSDSVASSPKISSAISNTSKNPFEDESYDEAKNPFADEETNEPTNPFGEDDDYDKNLNPFS